MRAKRGQLKAYWSKKENDIMFSWGAGGACKSDGALLCAVFTTSPKGFDKSLMQELEERGYDLSTIKFSVSIKTTYTPE